MDFALWGTMTGIFLTSAAYAWVLQKWQQYYPESYDDLTWFQVVIGVGYVLLWLKILLDVEIWILVCGAFFFACIPIVIHSIYNNAVRRREANDNGDD